MNILDIQKYLTLKPFDTATEQGRSDERYRLAALTVIAYPLFPYNSLVESPG